jgi:outer membrane protein assembly factor BamB
MTDHPSAMLVCRSVGVAVGLLVALLMVLLPWGATPVAGQVALPPPPPTISSVGPAIVEPGGEIKIGGRNLVEVRSVALAGLTLKYKVRTRKGITAKAPASAVRGTLVVTTRGGTAVSPRAIVVRPTISIEPTEGPAGSSVSVTGQGFVPGEPVDLYHGRVLVASSMADGRGRLPQTSLLVPINALAEATFVRVQGRFSGVPVDASHLVTSGWPQRGLGPEGNRRTRADVYLGAAASPALTLDWIADAIGPSRSSPAVVGGLVYAGADTGAVLVMPTDCAADGRRCDPRALGISWAAVSSSPAVADSVVYAGSEDGILYAFDATCPLADRPCDPLWRWDTGAPITSSPAVAEGIVVVGSDDGHVYAFDVSCLSDERGCRPRWIGQTGAAVRSSPAIQDGVVYIGSDDGYLHAFNATCAADGSTCEPLWKGWTGGVVRSSPAVANGLVYVGSADAKVHGFAVGCADDGRVCQAVWRGDADAAISSSPVIADGVIVVGTEAGSVMAFPAACADQAVGCPPTWTAVTGGPVRSSPAVSGAAPGGAMVFVGSDDGFLYGFPLACRPSGSPPTCQALWASGTSAPISASPAIVDGALYVSSEDGTIRRWSLP